MNRSLLRAALAGAAAVLVLSSSAAAQQVTVLDKVLPGCRIIPDTAAIIPSAGQVADRAALRDSLRAVAARHGVAEPRGLLFVLVDSIRRQGRVLYLQTNLPEAAVHESTRKMEEYVSTLPQGRGYQALVRVERPYVPPRAGARHCPPDLRDPRELNRMTEAVASHHPAAGTAASPGSLTTYVRMLIDHEGNVAYVDVDRPTGDAFLDKLTPEVASRLRFDPPTLDGVPFDARIRFAITYDVPGV